MIRVAALLTVLVTIALPAGAQIAVRNQGYIPFSEPPINYRSDYLHGTFLSASRPSTIALMTFTTRSRSSSRSWKMARPN
jgi:hypothetical protein